MADRVIIRKPTERIIIRTPGPQGPAGTGGGGGGTAAGTAGMVQYSGGSGVFDASAGLLYTEGTSTLETGTVQASTIQGDTISGDNLTAANAVTWAGAGRTVEILPPTGGTGVTSLTLPGTQPTVGQVMAFTAAGVGSWVTPATGGGTATGTNTGDQTITLTGDVTGSGTGSFPTTLATVNANVGSFGSATAVAVLTVDGKGRITAASSVTITPAVGSITGLGAGVATFLATPTSANLRAAVTDEAGTGVLYFVGGALGTPASGTLTSCTGLPIVAGTTGTLSVARGGTGATTFTAGNILFGNGTTSVAESANLTFETNNLYTKAGNFILGSTFPNRHTTTTNFGIFPGGGAAASGLIGNTSPAFAGLAINANRVFNASLANWTCQDTTRPCWSMYIAHGTSADLFDLSRGPATSGGSATISILRCDASFRSAFFAASFSATTGFTAKLAVDNVGGTASDTVLLVQANASQSGDYLLCRTSGGTAVAQINSGGSLLLKAVGQGLRVAEGTNAKQGTATLVAGSAVVSNTSVTATSRIFLTSNADGGTPGWLRVSARTAGTSFTITSSSGTDTSTVAYQIFEPA